MACGRTRDDPCGIEWQSQQILGQDVPVPRLHADELRIDVALVRRLVDRAFPEYVRDGLRGLHDSGSSNALFRLGKDKLVRMPRQPGGGASIDKEASWLPHVAPRVTAQVPVVVSVGEPDLEYPERWAISTWLHGTRPSPPRAPSGDHGTDGLAQDLAQFLTELRAMEVPERAKEDEALSWYRGLPLQEVDADFREAAAECRDLGIEPWTARVPRIRLRAGITAISWSRTCCLMTRAAWRR